MHIIICGGSTIIQEKLSKVLESCIINLNYEIKIEFKIFNAICYDMTEIIQTKNDNIYILDIEFDGISIAKNIREIDKYSKIIFLVNSKNQIDNILSNHIEVVDVLLKNDDFTNRIKKALEVSISNIMTPNFIYKLIVKDDIYFYNINLKDIFYIKKVKCSKYLNIYAGNNIRYYRSSIKCIYNKLKDRFVLIRSNTIVNIEHIKHVEFGKKIELHLSNDEVITDISRSGVKELKKLNLLS